MSSDPLASRRRLLSWFVRGALTTAGAAVAALAGLIAVPAASVRARRWTRAARFSDLEPNVPTPVIVTTARRDGWHRARRPQVIFLTVTRDDQVRALSATCTHLGCRVSWNAPADRFECPCHRGVYDRDGRVVSGPPPAPLPPVAARVDFARDEVHVEI
ncbi:MAG: Rieske 2Fe-2S domain-containing protein [Vicinamibacterales bacterium]